MLVSIDAHTNELIAEMHASKYGLRIFEHILTSLTIVVKPSYQGHGVGKALITAFLSEVYENWPEVGRIGLESCSMSQQSIGLYKSLGFVQEGRMVNKTRNADSRYEDSLLFARTRPNFSFTLQVSS
ncbi:GNAT family N-acetyltransferase [Spirosoma sp.]|uniref:GNAT family N-acetyltransferase n=1 Tax=Spirosoma sp. TaxID=1899569 RepID=UPI00261CFBAE|nr:GNAT family N-acetyltransferase [Spirosoma sp.]MCX6215631.1 GNAT family N-acetyltransferase [Spirosoma sp.]